MEPRRILNLRKPYASASAILLSVLITGCSSPSDPHPPEPSPKKSSASNSNRSTTGPDWQRARNPNVRPLPVPVSDHVRTRSAFTQKLNHTLAEFRRQYLGAPVTAVILNAQTGHPETLGPAPRTASFQYRVDSARLVAQVNRRAENSFARGTGGAASARGQVSREIVRLESRANEVLALAFGPSSRDYLSPEGLVELRRIRALNHALERARLMVMAMREPRAPTLTSSPRGTALSPRGSSRPALSAPPADQPLLLTPILATRIAELKWDSLFFREGNGFRKPEGFAPLTRSEANALRDRYQRVTLNLSAVPSRLNQIYLRVRDIQRARAEMLSALVSVETAIVEQRKALHRLSLLTRDDRIEGERVRLDQAQDWIATRKLQDLVQAWRPADR